jgi:hypothetical protein
MNPVIALITCPHCGNESATVHAQKNRGNKYYYRCYDGKNGDCGTIQITGISGQLFINKHMRPLAVEQLTEVVEDAKQAAQNQSVKSANKGKRQVEKNNPLHQVNDVNKHSDETPPTKKKNRLSAFFADENQ